MSKSNPPSSPIFERLRKSRDEAGPHHPTSLRRKLAVRSAALFRWLHIYASLLGLASVLFFAVTGLTLNHPQILGEVERRSDATGTIDSALLGSADDAAKLRIVEYLRARHGIRGALSEFSVEDRECLVSFRGPGYSADATIDRESRDYRLTQTAHGLVAIINDLHKGRDTGPIWSLVIDVSAVLLVFISLTGLALLFYLKLKRVRGLIVVLLGTIAMAALVYWGVP